MDSSSKEIFHYEQSHALLIGAWKYTNGYARLSGVEKEVESVGELLGSTIFPLRKPVKPEPPDEKGSTIVLWITLGFIEG